MCANPASPLWEDVLEKMSTSEKESYVKHFDKQLERVERMKYSEFTGSRAFGEKIKSTGQVGGYDVGKLSTTTSLFRPPDGRRFQVHHLEGDSLHDVCGRFRH